MNSPQQDTRPLRRFLIPLFACINASDENEATETFERDLSAYNHASEDGRKLWFCQNSQTHDLGEAEEVEGDDPITLERHLPRNTVAKIEDLSNVVRDLVAALDGTRTLTTLERRTLIERAQLLLVEDDDEIHELPPELDGLNPMASIASPIAPGA